MVTKLITSGIYRPPCVYLQPGIELLLERFKYFYFLPSTQFLRAAYTSPELFFSRASPKYHRNPRSTQRAVYFAST